MGLETVLNQILGAAQQEESNIMEQAQFERDRILAETQGRADELRAKGRAHADKRIEDLRRELLSAAEFEARRHLLVARRELSEDFLGRVRKGLAGLAPNRNQAILTRLVETARKELPQGTVHARRQ
ncbi:MAG TPA: V-type ATP synthase subunit E family protein, partial [Candidatus Thermoplasmatota archaeon]|nr:V-type ATP synthase subunit E family protein [Candidatus Thermoplasmatota archaeon]